MKTELEKYKEVLDNIIFNIIHNNEVITLVKMNEFDRIKLTIKEPNSKYEKEFIINRCSNYIDFLHEDLLKDYYNQQIKKCNDESINNTIKNLKDSIKKANELIETLEKNK